MHMIGWQGWLQNRFLITCWEMLEGQQAVGHWRKFEDAHGHGPGEVIPGEA